jgi:hypothetical protein
MADSGIHSVVVSIVKLFNGDEIKAQGGSALSELLFHKTDRDRVFDVQRVEIVTKGKDHFYFSGKIYQSLPKFDEIVTIQDFESSLNNSIKATEFRFHAAVRLSVTYPVSELSEYLEAAEDEGIESPNIFTWIQYCIDDATEVTLEDIGNSDDLKPLFTIRGL